MSQFSSEEQDLALAVLERDQLATAKSRKYGRRLLKGSEVFVLWALRLYLLFMLVVVAYQVVSTH